MTQAGFSELAFQISYLTEIASGDAGNPRMYGPTQVLEHIVGFDAAVDPGVDHSLWAVLGAERPPGIRLTSELFGIRAPGSLTKGSFPAWPISLFLQFKRPERLQSHSAKQWRLWHSPYYRFPITPAQQRVLKRLELDAAGRAVVRYAAPAFHELWELDVAQVSGRVVSQTGHVSPALLAGHKVWTYQRADDLGRGNPSGSWHQFEDLAAVLEEGYEPPPARSLELNQTDESQFFAHLRTLARSLLVGRQKLRLDLKRWREGLEPIGLAPRSLAALEDFAAIQTVISEMRGTWLVFDAVRP